MMEVETEHLFDTYRMSGAMAHADFQELCFKAEGAPIILGDESDVGYLIDHIEGVLDERLDQGFAGDDKALLTQGIAPILLEASTVRLPDWFQSRWNTQTREAVYEEETWPRVLASAPDDLITPFNPLDNAFKSEVLIGMIPVNEPYEIAAYMGFGGWKRCPNPHEHVAILKYWQEKYKAELTCMTGSIIELTVHQPPIKRAEAFALAKEQIAYCPELITPGAESVADLAVLLLGKKHWFFCWD